MFNNIDRLEPLSQVIQMGISLHHDIRVAEAEAQLGVNPAWEWVKSRWVA